MNDKLFDALEVCLQEIENGAALENVLARFPDLARELRPILHASIKARSLADTLPSQEAIRRGRAKLLQRASEMKEAKVAPRRRVIPIFQRLALSLGMAATFLLSGTGLVGASATALPGENLYPVKRTWEDLQLFFILNQNTRDAVKSQFEVERLHEVNELLAEGRHEVIRFAGVFMQINGTNYVSGVTVLVPATLQMPENGAPVVITGRTNAQGFVELESIELLPDGAFVPVGQPVEVETESESQSNSNSDSLSNSNEDSDNDSLNNASDSGSGSGSGGNDNNAAPGDEPSNREDFEVEGVVQSLSETSLVINGKTVFLDQTVVEGNLQNGVKVEIKGYYAADGRFIVTELKVKRSGTEGSNGNSNSGSDSGSSDSGGSDDNSSGSDDNSGGSDDGGSNSNDNSGGDDGGDSHGGGNSNDG